jgi:hypothetical protein
LEGESGRNLASVEYTSVAVRIKSQEILENQDGRTWIGFMWLSSTKIAVNTVTELWASQNAKNS